MPQLIAIQHKINIKRTTVLNPKQMQKFLGSKTQKALINLAKTAHSKWLEFAVNGTKTSTNDFKLGLSNPGSFVVSSNRVDITLFGWLPTVIETTGMSPTKMDTLFIDKLGKGKNELFGKPTAKKYIVVPFRHGAPTSRGQSTVSFPAMPSNVYYGLGKGKGSMTGAKNLKPSMSLGKGRMSWGGKTFPPKMREIHPPKKKHKESLYSSIYKIGGGKGQPNQYLSFRTMVEGGKPNVWHHPGIKKREFHKKVIKWINLNAKKAFRNL